MIEILLVDDESYVTESLKKTIPWEALNVRAVYTAASAMEAVAIMENQSIDILVTDIRMPEMDGLALVRLVSERWPDMRRILLTGYSDFEYAKKAIQLQVSDYILKPVDDDEFMRSILGAIESLKDEWEEADRYHRLLYDMKSDHSVLKENLMNDLLLGRQLSSRTIGDKLRQYALPISLDAPSFLMLIQLGSHFADYDPQSVRLIEFAVGNIAEEVLGASFKVWPSKAPHDCLVLLISGEIRPLRAEMEKLAREVGLQVRTHLKGDISIVVSPWFEFPSKLSAAYRSALGALLQHGRTNEASILFQEDYPESRYSVKSIEALYKPPTLIHLLESKQWTAAEEKIGEVFGYLEAEKAFITMEHLYEVYLCITNAYLYLVHKQGLLIHQIEGLEFDLMLNQSVLQSPERLRKWALLSLEKLKQEMSESDRYTKSHMIKQVQELVTQDIGLDISVKTIADKVYLHPVYLSKIYKSETGESLGDFIIRIRMEKALYLLKHSNKKIYEITSELGYQNPQYFSKMFKKHYGMTPNEYRD
ncbi:response regulator [Paenibacillus sp. BC26]|uniref:response regulator n=1 Tax=Paenibacillus sp. BC26 TaxID=1881032 RepID=UPI0008E7DE7E|nr:response regulator [Paenibacillus sp. BC26]SFT07851.1 two-component system, response regulator YesN [Paenibacillus sp. BC26]